MAVKIRVTFLSLRWPHSCDCGSLARTRPGAQPCYCLPTLLNTRALFNRNGFSNKLQALEEQVTDKREWRYEYRREAQEILPGASLVVEPGAAS